MDMSTVCIEGITVATLQKKKKKKTHTGLNMEIACYILV